MDNNKFKQLQEWNDLYKTGVITETEFNKKKREILGIADQTINEPTKQVEVKPIDSGYKNTDDIDAVVEIPKIEIGQDTSLESSNAKKRTPWLMIAVASILLLISAGTLSYFFYFKEKWLENRLPRYYTTANGTSLRSSKVAGVDNNYIMSLDYGTELINYNYQNDWSEVKVNAKKGFVSSKYILSKPDFLLLNSIFADNISKEAIETNKCRMALLDYFKKNQIMGVMDSTIEIEVFGNTSLQRETNGVWQVITRAKDVKPNTIFYANKLVNPSSRFKDFAFIVKQLNHGFRKTVLYSFADDETPIFITELNAPNEGNILDVTKYFNTSTNSYQYHISYDIGLYNNNMSTSNSDSAVGSHVNNPTMVTNPASVESGKIRLPNGSVLVANEGGIENQIISFLNNKTAKIDDIKGNWFDFDNLNFRIAKSEITESSLSQVKNIVSILSAFPSLKIKIGAYTDATGDAIANLKLSQARADAVKAAIIANGGNASQLTESKGYGSMFAKAPTTAPDYERKKDRRISIRIMQK